MPHERLTVYGARKPPALVEEMPLNTKIQTDDMGCPEFKYYEATYPKSKNTTALAFN